MGVFTAAVSILTGLLFGLAPIWSASQVSLNSTLKSGVRGATGKQGQSFRGGLVVSQVALSLALLVGASLLLRSFAKLQSVDLGYRPGGVFSTALTMPDARFPRRDADRREFLARVVEKVSTLPGVESAASVMGMPLSFIGARSALTVEGRPDPKGSDPQAAGYSQVSTNYFKTIGATLLKGRNFDARDSADAPMAMIVNERFARTFFPGEDPIGKRLRIMDSLRERPTEIVGIVRDMRQRNLAAPAAEEMYFPSAQRCWANAQIVVRTKNDPSGFERTFRSAVAELDPMQTVFFVRTLESLMDGALKQRRLQMTLLAAFAATAVLLSAVGIYGVMAYIVTRRTHEI